MVGVLDKLFTSGKVKMVLDLENRRGENNHSIIFSVDSGNTPISDITLRYKGNFETKLVRNKEFKNLLKR